MTAIFASLIAVTGALLGSLVTHQFARRAALRAEASARQERLRYDRLEMCGDFIAAVTEVKRAVITAWFRRDEPGDALEAALTEADIKGAAAEGAQLRMLLLIADDPLRQLSESLLAQPTFIRAASSLDELKAREIGFDVKRLEFIALARSYVG